MSVLSELAATRVGSRIAWALRSPARGPVAVRGASAFAIAVAAVYLGFGFAPVDLFGGLALGSLYGIIGVALVLVYRTNRIINFAASAIGAVPAVVGLILVTVDGVSYLVALPIALIGGPLCGVLTDLLVMRRFARAPRLLLTVVTIGVAQSFAVLGFFVPIWMGATAGQIPQVPTPWRHLAWHDHRGQPVLTGDQVFAFVVVVALTAGLAYFLKRTRMGIALRASAENADRAALLGIPVLRVSTVAWAIAGLLSGLAIYVQAPLVGVPGASTLGFDVLLYGLAAAVVARMDRLMVALAAGMVIGLIVFGTVATTGDNSKSAALMLVIILGALLFQRGMFSRALDTGVQTWQAVRAFRPIPTELQTEPAVVRARLLGLSVLVGAAIGLPYLAGPANIATLQLVPIWGIVAVSLVVLTGWAGQISLGQYGLVGIAAAVAGGLAAKHNIDFFAALTLGVAVGALTAVVIGLPAVRIQGLYLAVTTLAFGYAMQEYILNKHFWIGRHLLPATQAATLRRPVLYGRIDTNDDRTFYFVCVVFLALALAGALSFRRHRSGRILIAQRDNQRAAASFAVSPTRAKLAAFAVSGAIAGMAGVLLSYQQHQVIPGSYDVNSSIEIFLMASIGGLASVWAATLTAMALRAVVLFLPLLYPHLWYIQHHIGVTNSVMPLLLSGPLLVLALARSPGGIAETAFAARDELLRRIARRRGLSVPSLVREASLVPAK